MASTRQTAAISQLLQERTKPSRLAQLLILGRRKPLGSFGAIVIVVMIFLAVFAPFISPYDPYETRNDQRLKPPSSEFFMGTDNVGRDILSRVIWGSRISLWVGIVAVGLGTTSGSISGLVSGYFGGKTDFAIQRIMDMIMSFPMLVLAMAIVAMLGASTTNLMIALATVITPGASRVVRGAALSVKNNQYVEAAKAIGCRQTRILAIHILPNVTAPIIVLATVSLGTAILVEASLSFLGLGAQPPTPTWGGMLSTEGRAFFQIAPWMAIFPGIAISLAVLGFNLLGDALRDIWDPSLRGG